MTRNTRRSVGVVAAAAFAAVGTIAAIMPARATPVTFTMSGILQPGEDRTGFPVGSSSAVSVRLSYDPDLAPAVPPGSGQIRLEDSAQFSVRFGDLAVDLTGADGLNVDARGFGFHLMTPFLPAGRLPFTPDQTFLILSLFQTNSSGPGPFDGQSAPANLDAITPPDFGVQLSIVTPEGFQSIHAQLFDITRVVPEPSASALFAVGLAGLLILRSIRKLPASSGALPGSLGCGRSRKLLRA